MAHKLHVEIRGFSTLIYSFYIPLLFSALSATPPEFPHFGVGKSSAILHIAKTVHESNVDRTIDTTSAVF